jgi:glycerate kinase
VAIAAVQIRRGTEFIMDFVGLEDQIRQADFVITGEGKIDRQTLSGKVVKGVTDQARRWAKPVLAVAGRCDLNSEELWALGVGQLVVLADDQTPDQEAMTQAYRLLKARVSMAWKARRSDKKS